MDNSKTLELEILITISQNKSVPTCHFQHLFEHKWKLYYPRFNELMSDGAFNTATPITGMPYYELTSKGKTRITELIEQRESEISARLLQIEHQKTSITPYWKTIRAMLSTVLHVWAPTKKTSASARASDYHNLKVWISKRTRPEPHGHDLLQRH